MTRFFRGRLRLIDAMASIVRRAERKLAMHRHNLLTHAGHITPTEADLQALTQSRQDFLAKPVEIIQGLTENNEKYRPILEIYFLMKQTTALYEAESKRLPVQVFNEMRNALDHVARSMLPREADHEKKQLEKAEGHVQRAFLDTAKLLCALYDDGCNRRHNSFSAEQLGIVNNGEYIREFTRLQYLSHRAFAEAKLQDYELGGDDDKSVRERYIEAILAHKRVHDYQKNNYHNLRWAKARLSLIRGLKWTSTIIAGFIAGTLVNWGP